MNRWMESLLKALWLIANCGLALWLIYVAKVVKMFIPFGLVIPTPPPPPPAFRNLSEENCPAETEMP